MRRPIQKKDTEMSTPFHGGGQRNRKSGLMTQLCKTDMEREQPRRRQNQSLVSVSRPAPEAKQGIHAIFQAASRT